MKNYWLKRHERNEERWQRLENNWHHVSFTSTGNFYDDIVQVISNQCTKEIQEKADAEAWRVIKEACGEELVITMTTDDGHSFHEEIVIPDIDLNVDIPEPTIKGWHTADKHMIMMSSGDHIEIHDTTEV